MEVKCPEGCSACMKACPTQAIYEPQKLNPRKCISFNNWWTQDGRPKVTSRIPPEIREKIGTRVHGCDVCQEVCPRNQARLKANLPKDDFLIKLCSYAPEVKRKKYIEIVLRESHNHKKTKVNSYNAYDIARKLCDQEEARLMKLLENR